MRYGPPFRYARRSDGRRVAYQFDDCGTRSLKGIPDAWRLYAVELAGR